MIKYIKNPWNYVHCLGSFCLCSFINIVTKYYMIAFPIGLFWELLDELNKRFELNIWFLDDNGFDYRDLIADMIGILLFTLYLYLQGIK